MYVNSNNYLTVNMDGTKYAAAFKWGHSASGELLYACARSSFIYSGIANLVRLTIMSIHQRLFEAKIVVSKCSD